MEENPEFNTYVRWISKEDGDPNFEKLPSIRNFLGDGPFKVLEIKAASLQGRHCNEQFEIRIEPPANLPMAIKYNLWFWDGWFKQIAASNK